MTIYKHNPYSLLSLSCMFLFILFASDVWLTLVLHLSFFFFFLLFAHFDQIFCHHPYDVLWFGANQFPFNDVECEGHTQTQVPSLRGSVNTPLYRNWNYSKLWPFLIIFVLLHLGCAKLHNIQLNINL